uniref:Exportin 1 n=4 Tax=Percomorphaceae TaxID=1489872 RepID=A0A8D3C0Q6_SCOMX
MPAVMTMLADHAAQQLLDFNQKLDINLLDNVVNCLYHGVGPQQRMAQEVLTHLKEHPDAWTRVDTILEFSQNMNTKVSNFMYCTCVFWMPIAPAEVGYVVLAVFAPCSNS